MNTQNFLKTILLSNVHCASTPNSSYNFSIDHSSIHDSNYQ